MAKVSVVIPDLGGASDVEVIEILVAVGDVVGENDSILVLESDKASMDVPAGQSGTISEIKVSLGDAVNEGDEVMTLEGGAAQGDLLSPQSSGNNEPVSALSSEKPSENAKNDDGKTTPAPTPAKNDTSAKDIPAGGKRIVVIGAGPGGYTAAFRAADLGLDVTLVERYPSLGGVCLNVGCIPSKALLHSAAVISQAREMAAHGVTFGKPTIDVDKLRGFKESVISKLTGGLSGMAKSRKVTVVHGKAAFAGANTLTVNTADGDQAIEFDQAIIAAGSRVTVLPTFAIDDDRIIDSTGALELKDIPKSMLIVGGGIIGLEMATVYSELGCEVSIVEFMPDIITGADKDLVAPLRKRMNTLLKEIMTNTKVTELKPLKNGIEVHFENAKDGGALPAQTYDKVLIATGRQPNGDLINAQAAGVNVDERGFIAVDKKMRTNVSHIFAIGDIVGQPMLAHKATHEAKVAAEVCAGHKSAFEANVIPSVAYTDPELAWVGLTEIEAKKQGIEYDKAVFPWAASGRAIGNDRTEGKTKLLVDPKTERILGGGIVGTQAGDLISEVALAIEMGADVSDIALTIHPHPTLSESIAMAAEIQEGTITDLYMPKKK